MRASSSWLFFVGVVFGFTGLPITPGLAEETGRTNAVLGVVESLFQQQQLPLSIDPEAVVELESVTMDRASPAVALTLELVANHLSSHGFVFVPVQLTPNRKVHFLTKRSTAIYCAA